MVRVTYLALLWLFFQDPQAEGLKALDERRYEAAVAAFEKAAAANPRDFFAKFHLALALSLAGRNKDAILHYRQVLEQKPGLYEAELNLGIVLFEEKQFAAALPLLESAVATKPAEFRPRYFLGRTYYELNRVGDAETALAEAVKADPQSGQAALLLARVLVRQDKIAAAAEQYRRAAEVDPELQNAPLELADVYEATRQKDKAIAIYEKFTDRPNVQERLGLLYVETGRPAEAIPLLEKAVAASPTAANRLALGQAYQKTNQLDKAARQVAAAAEAEPRDAGLRLLAGRLLRDQRNFPAAANQFFAAAQLQPDSVEAWSELAGALILTEDYARAISALDKVRILGAEKSAHHWFRAISLDKLGAAKPALESYRKFLETADGSSPNEEFKARQRIRILEKEVKRR
jgi:tetratricopeptide (TPR) repeat protein